MQRTRRSHRVRGIEWDKRQRTKCEVRGKQTTMAYAHGHESSDRGNWAAVPIFLRDTHDAAGFHGDSPRRPSSKFALRHSYVAFSVPLWQIVCQSSERE